MKWGPRQRPASEGDPSWYTAQVRRLLPLLLLPLSSLHCSVEPVNLEGKTCPCGDGYSCVRGKCTQQEPSSDDASPPDDAGPDDAGPDDASPPDAEAGSDVVDGGCATLKVPPVARLAAGSRHTCAIRGGELWCWGINDRGQLGQGDLEPRSLPVRVGVESDWITVSASSGHTCGIRSTNNVGGLYCWGDNAFRQLGIGADEPVTPTPTPTLVSKNIQFRSVAAGDLHTCGLEQTGALWCWGRQEGGAVGLGNLDDPMPSPALVNLDSVVDISAGSGHNCAVRDDATMWCWGHYECFQLGSPDHQIEPHQVDEQCWRGVAAGATHTCGILEDDTLRCFGNNGRGQLGVGVSGGDPATDDCVGYMEPQVVQGDHRWVFVAGGTLHTCGITTEGALYCWGYNEQNQIADVDELEIPSPTRLGTESNWVDVAPGFFHTCARNTEDEIYCQGLDADGQQGTGTYNRNLKLVVF
jgi:alpha-tubulin suppressor-like RCC1 family protein